MLFLSPPRCLLTETTERCSAPVAYSRSLIALLSQYIICELQSTYFESCWACVVILMLEDYGAFENWIGGKLTSAWSRRRQFPPKREVLSELDCITTALFISATLRTLNPTHVRKCPSLLKRLIEALVWLQHCVRHWPLRAKKRNRNKLVSCNADKLQW
jgi:hypothetical protein